MPSYQVMRIMRTHALSVIQHRLKVTPVKRMIKWQEGCWMYKCNNLQCKTTKWQGLWELMPYLKKIGRYNHQHHNQTSTSYDEEEENHALSENHLLVQTPAPQPNQHILWWGRRKPKTYLSVDKRIKGWRRNHNAQYLHQHHQEGNEESFKPSSSKVYKEEDTTIEPPQLSQMRWLPSCYSIKRLISADGDYTICNWKKHQPSVMYDLTSSGTCRGMRVEQLLAAIYT